MGANVVNSTLTPFLCNLVVLKDSTCDYSYIHSVNNSNSDLLSVRFAVFDNLFFHFDKEFKQQLLYLSELNVEF